VEEEGAARVEGASALILLSSALRAELTEEALPRRPNLRTSDRTNNTTAREAAAAAQNLGRCQKAGGGAAATALLQGSAYWFESTPRRGSGARLQSERPEETRKRAELGAEGPRKAGEAGGAMAA